MYVYIYLAIVTCMFNVMKIKKVINKKTLQISLLRNTGQVVFMLVKLTSNTHSCSSLLQLRYGPPF